ncbi:MAG: hypothetical protein AAF585_22410 [Verrucomicrobiota bacterium]
MKMIKASLVAIVCIALLSCGDSETTPKPAGFPSSHKIFSFGLNGAGFGFASPEIPNEAELLELFDRELDSRLSEDSVADLRITVDGKTPLFLEMLFLHVGETGRVSYELYKQWTLRKADESQFILEIHGRPFSSPTEVGTYASIGEATKAIKSDTYSRMHDTISTEANK